MQETPETALANLVALLRERSLEFGDFRLASGKRSSFYVDARRTTMSAHGLALVGQVALATVRTAGWQPDAVGGLTLGADPVAYAIARASVDSPPIIDAFTVRKSPKAHGTLRLVEGCFAPGHRVVVVEDVITTGASACRAIDAVRDAGATVLGVVAVVDREQGGRAAIEAHDARVRALVTLQDLGVRP